ncbi:MAPEG family protein [Hoeflea prorocentri]|uniref:MAPEG family protein n=1 Tax=Hoeflea prorocentri TaxID=1922333 RepID=A0A9X3UGJ4_9HYPH|nr:MAPEG family protein [Hoeflea prorocentri]MCY6380261.1 MAPEG family protein [Hoeflea prorocentri]MDA5398061.1 MAPEG family protein [Hoeflea prorocentri]
MMTTTITFIGIFLLMLTVLSAITSGHRAKYEIDFGDGGNRKMMRALRAQGNFIEYVPMLLIGMGASEYAGAPGWLLWTGGWVLVVARLSHAGSLLGVGGTPGRLFGTGLTWLLLTVFGVYLIGRSTGLIA